VRSRLAPPEGLAAVVASMLAWAPMRGKAQVARRNARSGRKPLISRVNFLIAGVQKAGTSTLDGYLRQHPQIRMAKSKEIHFFDSNDRFRHAEPDYDAYHGFFPEPRDNVIYGEATPAYVYWAEAVPRIWQYHPGMKLIVLLRDPAERAWSNWRMENQRGRDPWTFSMAIREERDRSMEVLPAQHRVFSYLDRGFYSEQIRRIFRFFRPGQVLFLKSEDLFAEPAPSLRKVFQFLEVEETPVTGNLILNQGCALGEMDGADRKYLRDIFRWDVEQVKSMLGWDCGDWLA
jgi:hypothetical protein